MMKHHSLKSLLVPEELAKYDSMKYIMWILVMVMNLFGFITAPLMFPIAYALRDVKIVRRKLLWIYYDDEDEFGFDVDWWMVDREENFWTAYKWGAIRNPAWNLQALSIINPRWIKHLEHTKVLKFEDTYGGYRDNKGPVLSLTHSQLGSSFVSYILPGRFLGLQELWKYSFAGKIIGKLWMEIQIGFHSRATFRVKFKWITKIA